MAKIATGFVCVAVCFCVFNQSVEAMVGVSGYVIAAALILLAAGLLSWKGARAWLGGKSHSFDKRATDGGFLS